MYTYTLTKCYRNSTHTEELATPFPLICKLMGRKEQTENSVTLRKVANSKVRKPELFRRWGETVSRTDTPGCTHQGSPRLRHGSFVQRTPVSHGYSSVLPTASFLEAKVSPWDAQVLSQDVGCHTLRCQEALGQDMFSLAPVMLGGWVWRVRGQASGRMELGGRASGSACVWGWVQPEEVIPPTVEGIHVAGVWLGSLEAVTSQFYPLLPPLAPELTLLHPWGVVSSSPAPGPLPWGTPAGSTVGSTQD